MASKTAALKPKADMVYLCRALKAPSLAGAIDRLAERVPAHTWSQEEFLAACLERKAAPAKTAAKGAETRTHSFEIPNR